MKDTIIIGAGSVGGHVAANPELYDLEGKLLGFLDDDESKIGTSIMGLPVIGNIDWILDKKDILVIIGIAFPKTKLQIYKKISKNASLKFPSLISSNAWVSKHCKIGKGSIIYPNCSINYGSSIGEFVVLNMNCAFGHHATVGDFCSFAPGVLLGGNNSLGLGVDMGIGSATKQYIEIGDFAVVGGQAMVVNNILDGQTVIGVPAKPKNR